MQGLSMLTTRERGGINRDKDGGWSDDSLTRKKPFILRNGITCESMVRVQ